MVTSAGDINGDGVDDLLILDGSDSVSGRSYVVFGDVAPQFIVSPLTVHQNQTIILNSQDLNATDFNHPAAGLRFNVTDVQQGYFSLVNSTDQPITSFNQSQIWNGQIQFVHDGSQQAPNYTVQVQSDGLALPPPSQLANITFYRRPILLQNNLGVHQGETVLITANNLNVTDDYPTDQVVFMIDNIKHGQFQIAPNISVSQFSQQQILAGQVLFVQDNGTDAPSYQVILKDPYFTLPANTVNMTFYRQPIIENNQLVIHQGETVNMTTRFLNVTDDYPSNQIIFNINNVQHGRFKWVSANTTIVEFTQEQLEENQIQFVQDGTTGMPSYQVGVSDPYFILSPTSSVNVTFYVKPVFTQNQFLASAGQSTILTSVNLAATRAEVMEEGLQFLVSTVDYGRFEDRSNPGFEIFSFYQKDIIQQRIQFAADKSFQIPNCELQVRDSSTDLSSDTDQTGIILVVNNYFPINQADTLLINNDVLSAMSNRGDNGDILFTPLIGTVQHGQFELVSNPDYPLASFFQKQITANEIVFVSDNVTTAPSAYLMISDQTGSIQGTVSCQVDFDAAPVLQNAYLMTRVKERVKITDINLKATSLTAPVSELVFEISEITHGYFADNNQWNVELSNFTQQQITAGNIIFVTDDSGLIPQFKVSVWDGRLHCWTCPQSADVVLDGGSSSGSSLSESIKNTIITSTVSGAVGLLFVLLKICLKRMAEKKLENVLGNGSGSYEQKVVSPLAFKIAQRLKITGFMGHTTNKEMSEFKNAVETLIRCLSNVGINLAKMDDETERKQWIDEIATQTKECFLPSNRNCCKKSYDSVVSFFSSEVSPDMIEKEAKAIIGKVREAMGKNSDKTFQVVDKIAPTHTQRRCCPSIWGNKSKNHVDSMQESKSDYEPLPGSASLNVENQKSSWRCC